MKISLESEIAPRESLIQEIVTTIWKFFREGKRWLGRQDSNLGMPVPKTGALPLGDAPTTLIAKGG
jgi:hypothetical protein